MEQLRKYRINEHGFNQNNDGIALFDLIGTFVIAYVFEKIVVNYLHITRKTYYLSLIPVGVLVHLITKQETFLNKQLFNSNVNIYKILLVINLYLLWNSLQN